MSAASKGKDAAKKVKAKVGGAGRDAKGRFKAVAATQDAAKHVTVKAKKKAKPAAK